jgi:hypothetical protein
LGFPRNNGPHAVKLSERFHEDPIVAKSFTEEKIVPWLKQPAAASWIWRFPRKK